MTVDFTPKSSPGNLPITLRAKAPLQKMVERIGGGQAEFGGANIGGISFKPVKPLEEKKDILEIKGKELAIKKAQKELESGSGNILQSAPIMLDIANQAADNLNKKGMMGPIGGRLSGLGAKVGGVPGLMSSTDVINRGLGESSTKLLQYMAAAGLAGQQGRGLSDADLRIAGAMAPNFGEETYPLVKAKIAVLGKAARGDLSGNEIKSILSGDYQKIIDSYMKGMTKGQKEIKGKAGLQKDSLGIF